MTTLPSLSKRQDNIYREAKSVDSKLSPIPSHFIRLACYRFPHNAYQWWELAYIIHFICWLSYIFSTATSAAPMQTGCHITATVPPAPRMMPIKVGP